MSLWGATSSGKSTFLCALPLAVDEQGWTVTAVDNGSRQFLGSARNTLLRDGKLPAATRDRLDIHWELRRPGRRRLLRREPPVLIDLRMTDRPGRQFQNPDADLIDELEACHAIVYLFDAQREFTHRDAFTFFSTTMDALRQRVRDRLLPSGQLPHHLAVCVPKLDDTPMVHQARCGLWLTQDAEPPHLPRVADEHAEAFFHWLCQDPRARAAESVRRQIRNNFAVDRTRYYVTSAIGFKVAPGGTVDLDDPDNLRMEPEGYRLKTSPRPINVLEPLVGLQRAVARSSP